MSGWIKLHRGIREWEWKRKPLTMALWIHILTNANHTPRRFEGHEIPVGSLVAGVKSLAEQTGLSVSQVRTALKHLSGEELTITPTSKFSIITVTKWHHYQTGDKQIANKSQTDDKPIATLKEGKKERRKEEGVSCETPSPKKSSSRGSRLREDWSLPEAWGDWAVGEGVSVEAILREEEKFKDYWIGVGGAKGVKANWEATWRNWIRRGKEDGKF